MLSLSSGIYLISDECPTTQAAESLEKLSRLKRPTFKKSLFSGLGQGGKKNIENALAFQNSGCVSRPNMASGWRSEAAG